MVSMFTKALIGRGNTQVHLQFFCKSIFSRDRKTVLIRKGIALLLQVNFRFMGCLVKANALVRKQKTQYRRYYQLIVLLFLQNSHLQRDIQQTFFRQFLCELFENFCSASKYVSKTLRKFNKKKTKTKKRNKKTRPWRKVFAKFTGKRLCQRLYLNKVTGLRL